MKAKHTTGPSLPLERIKKSWCMAIICYITTTSTNTRVRLSSVCRSRANESLLFLPVQFMQSQLPDPPIAKISRSWIVHQLRTVRSIKLYSASDSRKISMISRRSSPHATSWSTKTWLTTLIWTNICLGEKNICMSAYWLKFFIGAVKSVWIKPWSFYRRSLRIERKSSRSKKQKRTVTKFITKLVEVLDQLIRMHPEPIPSLAPIDLNQPLVACLISFTSVNFFSSKIVMAPSKSWATHLWQA